MSNAHSQSEDSAEARSESVSARFPNALRFIFMAMPQGFFDPLDNIAVEDPGPFAQARRAFVSNLRRAETVAAVPYKMAFSAVTDQRFNMILTAERIRQLKDSGPGKDLTPEAKARALSIARQRMHEEMAEDLTRKPLPRSAEGTLSVLESHLREPEFVDAAKELILQTLTSIWGAFELLANDVVGISLNENPALAARLVNEAPAKKHFPTKALSFDALMEHDFNISGSMGDILLGERSLSSLEAIRDVFSTLAAGRKTLHHALGSDDLWRLWQRRHVVVHRRGIVDRGYLDRTGDEAQSVGTPLTVRSRDIEAAFGTVRDAGAALLSWKACASLDSEG